MPTKEEYAQRKEYYKKYSTTEARKATIKKYYQTHKRNSSNNYKKKWYGISHEEYQKLKEESDNHCGLCLKLVDKLVLDHSHSTGKVRQFLCYNCNTGLGHFGDSVELLQRAIDYLNIYDGMGY